MQGDKVGVPLLHGVGAEWEAEGDVVDRVRCTAGGDGGVGDGDLDMGSHSRLRVWIGGSGKREAPRVLPGTHEVAL